MDTVNIKRMKEELYEPWNQIDHITNFGIRLYEEQEHLTNNKIVILDEDKLQFYIEQMYASQSFECKEMKAHEKRGEADRNNDEAKAHFKEIAEDNEIYTVTSSSMVRNHGYESAAHIKGCNLADGDKLCKYLGSMFMVIESSSGDKEYIQQLSTTN